MQCVETVFLDRFQAVPDHVLHMADPALSQKNTSIAERRGAARCKAGIRCWLTDGHVERFARLEDVSESGARVLTAMPPPVGQSLVVRFRLAHGSHDIEGTARVVWRSEGFRGRGGVIGIHFEQIGSRDEIRRFVAASTEVV